MPFVSKAQRRWAFARHMSWAKEWEDKTKGPLPNRVGGKTIEQRILASEKKKKKK